MDPLAERLKNMTPLQRAVFALKETQARLDAVEQKRAEPIAIVGMACRFPGGAWDAKSYWRLLCERVDAIRVVPADRWDVDAFYDPDPAAHGKMNTRWGGFLDRIDEFDNHFFSISDREALRLDPQQRMLLELAWEAMEDAGIPPSTLRGSRTGVFVGIAVSEYGIMLSTDLAQTDAHAAAGTSLCLAANRLSFAFGLQGPSLALDTACSSALVAVHMACQNIRAGECDAALAGGANLILSPIGTVNLTKAGFCASDGRVRAFDAAASGYVRSEGAGLVLLKPLSAALKNRDPIYALIRGSAVNQNGSSNGLTAPSRAAQEQVLREAYARARVSPGRAQFVETQGTGTRLGDAIEALALGNVLREGRAVGNRCAIGAVKSNIGHLETASGVASLMKVALALTHRQIPPNLHFRTPNPDIPFDALPIEVQQNLAPWPESAEPRIAGVSAFGFGGSNAHLVLEESPQIPDEPRGNSSAATDAAPATADGLRPPAAFLLPLSARTEKAIADLAARYDEFLHADPPAWREVCYTAAARRDHHDCRLAVLAGSHAQALELLRAFGKGESRPGLFQGRKPYGRSLKVAFVFDGNTERWKSCLPQSIPAFAVAAKDVEAALARVSGSSLADLRGDDPRWADPAFARPMTLALQLALAAWWRHVGLAPDAVLGQGVGELAAGATAGMFSLDDALRVAAATGGSASSASTSQSSALAGVPTRPALLPVLDASQGLAAAVGALGERHVDVCLEIGPQAMSESIARFLSAHGSAAVALPSLAPSAGDGGDVLTALGVLYAAGADLAWEPLTPSDGRPVRLPTYPWQRQRLWAPTKKWLPAVVGAGQAGAAPQPAATAELPDEHPSVGAPTAVEVHVRPDLTTPYVAPGTELERTMARLWSEVLRIDRVGIHDNFFELGGDSLQAAILLNQLPAALGRQFSLPLRDVFEARTIATLSGRIEAALQATGAAATDGPIPRIARHSELPLSFNQESLWFLGRLEPDRPSYMLYLALNVKGPLSIPALERALNEIARRHEILRTRFPEVDGRPVQVIEPAASRSLSVVDLSALPPREREVELRRKIAVEMGRPIDFENGPLVRIILLRRAENDYVAAASLHHIIHDGWSVGLVLGELAVLYPAFLAGRPSPLPELPIQFADYATWQRGSLQGETLERLQDYWRRQLAGVSPLEIPTDFSRPAVRSTRGSSRRCELSAETSAAVLEFCRREGATPYMVLLAAFEVLLARYSGQDDFAVGTPVANRGRPELESLVGYLVNVVVLRASLAGDRSFREAVGRVQRVALDAFEHQALSLDQVVHAVRPTRDLSRNPIFQVMFALHNLQLPSMPNLPLEITPLADCPAPPSANFDLTLELFQTGERFQGSLNFSTDLFDPATIDRMVGQYQVLVAAAIRDPDRAVAALPLLEEEEQREMLGQGRGPVRDYDREQPVHRLFETQAERQPEAVAVVLGDQRWSYGELNARANQLARFLRREGVGPETRVGICLDRSPQLVMAVLAVMKAGGAYVPLDPAYTRAAEERFKYVLADAQVSLLLTDSALPAALDTGPAKRIVLDGPLREDVDREGRDNLDAKASAAQLAYVLYTSGSTGRPKGVMVTQGNLLNAYHGWREAYRLESAARSHLQMASFSFDVFEGDLVRALCSGGKLVICRKEILLDPAELLSLMRRESVDIAEFVPIVLRNLVEYLEETGQTLEFMRLVIAGSDAWYAADHRRTQRVLGPQTRLINSYGLTETTIDSSFFEGDAGLRADSALMPIGRPLPNVQLYVLDEQMRPVPPGLPGMLYIGGDGVSRGYVNQDLNAERFPKDPFAPAAEARLCRTGDRARWLSDGQLEFLGRADTQLKISGYRIEPAEIEQVLREQASVADAVVAARERSPGDVRLVAYVVVKEGLSLDLAELRPLLVDRLPGYMIPAAFVPLAALPATTSGKLDRKALPAPDWSLAAAEREYVAPGTPTEQQLAEIWSEVLGVERIGARDNFFELGGNSFSALRLVAKIRRAFSAGVPLVALFTAPTIADLALVVDKARQGGGAVMPHLAIGARPAVPGAAAAAASTSFATIEYRPLEELIRTGHMEPLDSAALAYWPELLLEQFPMLREFLQIGWLVRRPLLTEVRQTPWGRMGVVMLPVFDSELYTDQRRLVQFAVDGLDLAGALGARCVSLTGLIPSATDNGRALLEAMCGRGGLPRPTTGHATTAASVVLSLRRALREAARTLPGERLACLGLGSIGSATLRLMMSSLPHPREIILCDLFSKAALLGEIQRELHERLGYQGSVRVVPSPSGKVPEELYEATTIVAATNVAEVLEIDRVRPGTIIVDDSGPHCFSTRAAVERFEKSADVLFTEGGVLKSPQSISQSRYLPPGIETLLAPDALRVLTAYDPHHITGCMLSGLLSARFDDVRATIGPLRLEDLNANFEKLLSLEFDAAELHCNDYGLARALVQRFQDQFRESGAAEGAPSAGRLPISFNQEAFWVPCRLRPDAPLSHLHAALPVQGELNVDALRRTVNEVVRRHESLRTHFALGEDGRPVQVIVPGLRVELPMEDLPAERRDELIQSLSLAQASEVFDFFRGPLFRVRLLRFGPADHVVLVTVHHIIADGWSVQVLLQEVLQLYDAFSSDRPSPLAELPIQYADYTLWQRDYLQGAALTSLAAYWRKQLAGVHSPALPFDRPWRAEDEHRRNRRAFRVSAETRGRLERIGRAIHTTPFMLTLAAYQVLLHSYGDSDDVAVAVPIANRDRAETQGLIGCFLSTLILRSGLGGDCTFREALLRVRKTVIEGFDHQDLPIELMIRELGLDYQPLRYPFTHVLFSYHESSATGPLPSYIPLALSYRPTDLNPQATRFALELTLTETSDGLAGLLEYDAALFDPETVEKIEGDFTRLLAAIATNPELRLSQLLPPPTHAGAEPAIQCRPPAAEAAWETADSPVPWSSQRQSLVPLRREGSKRPLFLIHGLGGYVAALVPLTRGLAVDCPVYGLQAQGLDAGQTPHDSIGAMADFYLREIRQVQPSGPYLLGGWSMGGIIALEAARQLGEAGEAVSLLAMLDSYLSLADFEKLDLDDQTVLRWIAPRLKLSATELRKLPLERQWERIEEQAMRSEGIGVAEIRRLAVVCKAHLAAICRYVRRPYPGPAVLFTAGRGGGNPAGAWSAICPRLRVEPISGDHYTMLRKPDVDVLAERLGRYLQEALAGGEMTRNE